MIQAKIYKPGKSAMQSGGGRVVPWVLEYEAESARTPEPLMGWVSSGDTLNQVSLKFDTLETAEQFAQAQNMRYTVSQPREHQAKPRNYSDKFRYVPFKEEKGA